MSADPPPPYRLDDSELETEELNRKVAATIETTIRMVNVGRSETPRPAVRFDPMTESIPRNSTSSVRSDASLSSGYSANEPMLATSNANANTNTHAKKDSASKKPSRPRTVDPEYEQGCCFSTTNGCCFSTDGGCCCEGE